MMRRKEYILEFKPVIDIELNSLYVCMYGWMCVYFCFQLY